MSDLWGADTRVSKPEPKDNDTPVLVDFGGFGFDAGGIRHDVTATDVEEIFFPPLAPEGFRG